MIAMQVTNEDMVYFADSYPVPSQLHLRALTAVNQKQTLMYIKYMSGWVSF